MIFRTIHYSVLIVPGPGVNNGVRFTACFGKLTRSGSIFTQAALLSVQMFPTASAQSMLSSMPARATAKRPAKRGSLLARMTTRLRRAGYRSRYRLRKRAVEPVFGQIKQARGFRQFLLRGIEKVNAE
jgi:Transposase DDE domain